MQRVVLGAVVLLVAVSCGPAWLASPAGSPGASSVGGLSEVVSGAAGLPPPEPPGDPDPPDVDPDADDPWMAALAQAHQQLVDLAADDPQRTKPEVAGDPLGLAAQLQIAELALRDDDAGPAVWAAAGHVQQLAIRHLVARPEWDDEVRAAMSEPLVGFLDLHLDAGRELADMHPTPDFAPDEWPDPPPWRIVEPTPKQELLGYYQQSAETVGIHWAYLAAINLIETRMGRIDGTSWAGAQGPMQFIPTTWDWVGAGNVHDDHDAIMAAGRLLDVNGAPGDMAGAIFGYNNDVRYVRAVQRYAAAMKAEPRALRGYYYWQVYIPGPEGSRLLPIGFDGR